MVARGESARDCHTMLYVSLPSFPMTDLANWKLNPLLLSERRSSEASQRSMVRRSDMVIVVFAGIDNKFY
jgi:hypothetical protein